MSQDEKITIRTWHGPVQVTGFRVAQHFIIHDAVGEEGVAITHAATGFRAFMTSSIQMAIEAAHALQRIGDIWDFTNPDVGHALIESHGEQLQSLYASVVEGDIEKVRRFHNDFH